MGALIDSRELDWDPHVESFRLLIVGSPSLKISVYPKHISLRSGRWPGLFFNPADRVVAAAQPGSLGLRPI